MPSHFTKQPEENLDYDFDFGEKWLPTGDTLQSSTGTSTVTATPNTLTLGTKTHNTTDGIVKQWVSGGTQGQRYILTCRVTTTQGRIKEAEMVIDILNLPTHT